MSRLEFASTGLVSCAAAPSFIWPDSCDWPARASAPSLPATSLPLYNLCLLKSSESHQDATSETAITAASQMAKTKVAPVKKAGSAVARASRSASPVGDDNQDGHTGSDNEEAGGSDVEVLKPAKRVTKAPSTSNAAVATTKAAAAAAKKGKGRAVDPQQQNSALLETDSHAGASVAERLLKAEVNMIKTERNAVCLFTTCYTRLE